MIIDFSGQSAPMASLGGILFTPTILAFNEVCLEHTFGWKRHTTVTSVWQVPLPSERRTTVTIKGEFLPSFHTFSREHNLEKLIELADKGEPVALTLCGIDGARKPGDFVIKAIKENRSLFRKSGRAAKVGFTVELESYHAA